MAEIFGPRTLLVVEDLAETREWLGVLLRKKFPEARVQLADGGVAFHRALQKDRPDLVLLDEVLGPGEDSAGILRMLEVEKISVILLTGMLQTTSRALPAIALARLAKPRWSTGAGVETFLEELTRAWSLTATFREG